MRRDVALGPKIASAALIALMSGCGDPVAPPASTAFVAPPSDSLFVGSSLRIVSVSTRDGAVVTAAPFEWSSSDTSVAVVDAAGTVVGVGVGNATIVATLEGNRNSFTARVVAHRVDGGERFATASTGDSRNCALDSAGRAYCRSTSGADSLGTLVLLPGAVGASFASFQSSPSHACGLAGDGVLYCVGGNLNGQRGTGTTSNDFTTDLAAGGGSLRFTTVAVGGGSSFIGVTCGTNRADSVVYCVGDSSNLQAGRPAADTAHTFAPVTGSFRAIRVTVGRAHTCALAPDRSAYCWGYNVQSVLGFDGPSITTAEPQRIPGGHAFAQISSGSHACAITVGGDLYCWGSNAVGQLGLGQTDLDGHPNPVRMNVAAKFSSVLAGNGYTCALTTEGRLWCWGILPLRGAYAAQFVAGRNAPIALAKGITFRSISADAAHICGVTTDDHVVCL